MTYALSWPLQAAVRACLAADPAVTALIGDSLHDAPPQIDGPLAAEGVYAVIGDEAVADWSTKTDRGAEHRIAIAVYAAAEGFAAAKEAAGAICDALLAGPLAPSRGHVVGVHFLGAETAREEEGALRRVTLRFRVVVEDTA
jgi:hypothetical protein